jgi:hypothetical protein
VGAVVHLLVGRQALPLVLLSVQLLQAVQTRLHVHVDVRDHKLFLVGIWLRVIDNVGVVIYRERPESSVCLLVSGDSFASEMRTSCFLAAESGMIEVNVKFGAMIP